MKKDLELFNRIANKLLQAEIDDPVVTPIHPKKMLERFDLALDDDAIDDERFIESLEDIILQTPRTASNRFFNQLSGGRSSRATLGELLAVMLNNTMATYKVAGPQVGVEQVIIRKVCDIIGYNENSSGTMAPGGSISILMSMLMARDYYNKDIRNEGGQSNMTLYTSAESHYSIPKNASFVGVGRDNVRFVKTNDKGQMLASDLEVQIKKDIEDGKSPFFVNATIGTTVLSAIDPINEIADVCDKYNLWLHADGAFLGPIIFSDKYKHMVKGLNRASSFSFNPHKMLDTPISTSIIVTNHNECLVNTFSNEAEYLYQTSSDEHNLGKISMQCGRKNDGLKFWCLWKSVGTKGLAKIVDHEFYLADVARDYIKNNPNYTLYSFDNAITVCFNYKNIPAKDLCTQLYREGELMVGFGKFKEDEFVRFVTVNGGNSKEDILNFFKLLEDFADKNF